MKPRALLLENVRGLSMPRFSAYRQHVKDRLKDLGIGPTGDFCMRMTTAFLSCGPVLCLSPCAMRMLNGFTGRKRRQPMTRLELRCMK